MLRDGHETLELLVPVLNEDDLRLDRRTRVVGQLGVLDHQEPLAVRVYVVGSTRASDEVLRLEQHLGVARPERGLGGQDRHPDHPGRRAIKQLTPIGRPQGLPSAVGRDDLPVAVTVQALWNVGTDFVLVPFAVISYALGDEAGAHEAIAA